VARTAGAEVWERVDPLHRGKGHALAWAFERALDDAEVQAVCVIDADCELSTNLLTAVAARIRAGAEAVQVPYLVSNPERSPATALRWAGFALFNLVRPLGRDRFGLSSGLLGTGMGFSRRLLLRSPWEAFSFAEDREQHMRWVLDGARVAFAPEAQVRSPSPGTLAGARAQERRWESGRGRLAARLTPRLLARSLRTRNPVDLDAALEPVLPPQSLLLAINLGSMAAARIGASRGIFRLAAGAALAQAIYVVGGLALVRAPGSVWRAFASLPGFLARRLLVLAGARTGPSAWERTPRDAETSTERLLGADA
jgi:1,2-diacylglycerol 3-beta-glucosyltransferase